MELDCIHDNINLDCITVAYTKTPQDDTTLCIVCQVEEPGDVCWDRYLYKCGHIFHSRCIRLWCGKKGKLNCPLWGCETDTG